MVERVGILASQHGVGKALVGNLRHQESEAIFIVEWVVFRGDGWPSLSHLK
jgi:hypothetical protein